MIKNKKILENFRSRWMDAFEEFSAQDSISINPLRDKRMLNLCDRLYSERRGDRAIDCDYEPDSNIKSDAFVKSAGMKPNEYDLLTISLNHDEPDFELLWKIYKAWIHDCVSGEKILSMIK